MSLELVSVGAGYYGGDVLLWCLVIKVTSEKVIHENPRSALECCRWRSPPEGSRTRCGLDMDGGSEAEVTPGEVTLCEVTSGENLIADSLFSGTKVASLSSPVWVVPG